ncbi:MAG: DNRLRE domain-containing protein, partial [Acidobacteria bacterium]|nr:DNRLRE domain-containing protein [Acidobacteriota bacterium]
GPVRSLVWVAGTEAGPAGPDPWSGGGGESESSGPALSVVEPSAFLQVNPVGLEVVLAYAEGASPLDLGSLAVRLDGVEVTASCTAEAAGAVCALGGQVEGLHLVEAELSDTAGEVARVERSFQVLVGEGSHEVALPASADSFVRGWLRNRNEGTTSYLELRLLGPHRSLVAFDIAELAGVVESLEEARLELFVEANAFNWGFGGREVDAHRLLEPWSEAGVTWNCPEDTDPGNFQADCESPWNGGSYDPLASSSVLHTSETSGWVSFDATADVGAALSGGESFGWLVKKRQEWLFGLVRYTSKEGEASQAPRLVVRFTGGEAQDLEPPELTVTAPAEGALLSTSTPALTVSYSDAGTGVDPSGLSFEANGSALAVSCAAGETGATCTPSVALPEGLVMLSATVADLAGNVSPPASVSFTVDTVAPASVDLGAVAVSPPAAGRVSVTGSAGAAEPGATVRVTNLTTEESVEVLSGADGSFAAELGGASGELLELVAVDGAGNIGPAVAVAVPDPPTDPNLPPDPSTVAPPLDRTVVTDLFTATEFLYSGPDPIQTGVAAGTIEARRAAVLRGRVLDRAGAPLPGVTVTVLGHPELGQTLSRADGVFDLVVNGGGLLTLTYAKTGYLPIQRQVQAPWRDYAWAPDVVFLPYDESTTVITSGAVDAQVARGSSETDADGTRQATLVFPAGTTAELELSDGSRQALASMTIRATEYTVGPMGPQAMPGPLPATVGYTYAVELSADEAEAAGAVAVHFSQPVSLYVENFLGFPVGESVPLGYWDRQQAAWIGSPNGRVVEVLGTDAGGLAELDVDGTGTAASAAALASLGVTDGERERLAGLYGSGTSLWRSPIPHLTPWDCNWPYVPPEDAVAPPDDDPVFDPGDFGDPDDPNSPDNPDNPNDPEQPDDPDNPSDPEDPENDEQDEDDACEQQGSVLECENQVLGESIRLSGTPFQLNYSSDRQVGRGAAYSMRLGVSGSELPASLRAIQLQVFVGGQQVADRRFPAIPNQTATLTWDGEDAYRRRVQGELPVTVRKSYIYGLVYASSADLSISWARYPSGSFSAQISRSGGTFTLSRSFEGTLEQNGREYLGTWDAREQGLGGWSLDIHHVYDPNSRTLYPGYGGRRTARAIGPVLTAYAGTGTEGYSGDGGPAVEATFSSPSGMALMEDGSLLVADRLNHVIRRISPDGLVSTIAGTGEACGADGDGGGQCGPLGCGVTGRSGSGGTGSKAMVAGEGDGVCGDGGLATDALLNFPEDVAVGPGGAILIADTGAGCIRRIDASGVIETIAGQCIPASGPQGLRSGLEARAGESVFPDDGFPATEAILFAPHDIDVALDGSYYIADRARRRVGFVGTDGIFSTVAGGGTQDGAEGLRATEVHLDGLSGIALSPGGDVFIAQASPGLHRIWRVGVGGVLHAFAGSGGDAFGGDGRDAKLAGLSFPGRLVATADGSLYLSDVGNRRVRKVDPAGIIFTVVGNGEADASQVGAPAAGTPVAEPAGLVVSPDSEIFLVDTGQNRVLRAGLALAGFSEGEIAIASEGGTVLHVFDPQGRHLRTVHALTGADIYRFTYGEDGLLGSVTDRNGQTTR